MSKDKPDTPDAPGEPLALPETPASRSGTSTLKRARRRKAEDAPPLGDGVVEVIVSKGEKVVGGEPAERGLSSAEVSGAGDVDGDVDEGRAVMNTPVEGGAASSDAASNDTAASDAAASNAANDAVKDAAVVDDVVVGAGASGVEVTDPGGSVGAASSGSFVEGSPKDAGVLGASDSDDGELEREDGPRRKVKLVRRPAPRRPPPSMRKKHVRLVRGPRQKPEVSVKDEVVDGLGALEGGAAVEAEEGAGRRVRVVRKRSKEPAQSEARRAKESAASAAAEAVVEDERRALPAPDARGEGTEGPLRAVVEAMLPELLRRAVAVGGGVLTEEALRRVVAEVPLAGAVVDSGVGREVSRVVGVEVQRFLKRMNLSREFEKVLTRVALEIRTEVRFKPTADGELRPAVTNEVRVIRVERDPEPGPPARKK